MIKGPPAATRPILTFLLLTTAAVFSPRPGVAQYMYLDSNGNGIHDVGDRMASNGTTVAEVWLDSAHNRDGSAAVCQTGTDSLTVNSYEFILHVSDGTVSWGSYVNHRSAMASSLELRSNATDYHNGFAGGAIDPPGLYHLGTLMIQTDTGAPRVDIAQSTALGGAFSTSFGSQCPGTDTDNTLKCGSDWMDADGLSEPSELFVTVQGEQVFPTEAAPESPSGSSGAPVDSGCPQGAVACNLSPVPTVLACGATPESISSTVSTYTVKDHLGNFLNCDVIVRATSNLSSEINTGGHCHDPTTRPLPTCVPSSGTTAGSAGLQVTHTWPEVAGRFHIWVETVAGSPCGPVQQILTVCVRRVPTFEAGMMPLVEAPGYELTHGPDNATRHPDHHYGTPKFIEALKKIAQSFRDSIPGVPILGYNDMSLRWGGVFDVDPPPLWSQPHCGHRNGDMVDMRTHVSGVARYTRNQLGKLKKLLRDLNIRPIIHEPGSGVAPHWHLQPVKRGSFN